MNVKIKEEIFILFLFILTFIVFVVLIEHIFLLIIIAFLDPCTNVIRKRKEFFSFSILFYS